MFKVIGEVCYMSILCEREIEKCYMYRGDRFI